MTLTAVRVEVTARDIAAGKPCDPCGCAVALAVSRACGGKRVTVYGSAIEFPDLRRVELCEAGREVVTLFDRGDEASRRALRAAAPIAFTQQVPA